MASILKHLRSSTADKRPTASGLADGQIALNTASGTPAMFFKDSAGNIVKVGPAHIGTTAPNVSPAGSAGNSDGELWIDESLTTRGLKYYDGTAFVNLTPSGTTSTVGLVELATDAETQAGTDNVRVVTPSGLQSKISDSTSTTSSTTIASSTAVKSAFDLANAALPKAGGTLTGELLISPSGSLVFEGSSDDSFETTIAVTNPTADRTITFPNVTGNVVTTGDSGTVTSTMILDDTIVNADINSAAAIAHSKLANITAGSVLLGNASNVPTATALSGDVTINSSGVTAISAGVIVNADINASAAIVDTKLDIISTADKVSLSALNIDGATDIGGALENGDLFVVDDGAGGTNRKAQAFRMAQLTYSGVTGDITVASGGTAAISAGVIVNADVNASAAIAGTKISPDFGSQTITTTGVVSAALGAAATPSLTFTGDLNTGIYSPGADQLAISTGGSGRLFVASDGKIGIGSSGSGTQSARTFIEGSGACPLEIDATAGSGGYLTLSNSGSAKAFFGFGSNIGTASVNDIAIRSQSGALAFQTGGANERLRITSTGALNFVGAGTAGSTQAVSFNGSAPVNSLVIDSSGRLGVGTSSPQTLLHLANTAQQRFNCLSTANAISFWKDGTPTFAAEVGIGGATGITSTMKFDIYNGSAWNTAMTIDSSSRVGIGTSSPQSVLNISAASGGDTSGLRITRTDAGGGDWRIWSSATANGEGAGKLIFGNSANRVTIDGSGNVGIGTTSPSERLHVSGGNSRFDGNYISLGNNGYIRTDATNELRFQSGSSGTTFWNTGLSSEMARFDTSGRLLVGTSSASDSGALLKVQGNTGGSTGAGWLEIRRGITTPASGGQLALLSFADASGNQYADIQALVDATPGTNDYPGRLVFSTTADGASSPTERMRISSAGHIIFVKTSTSTTTRGSYIDGTVGTFVSAQPDAGSSAAFYATSTGNLIGSISHTTTATSYATSSDYRLKENTEPVVDGILRLQQLKPSRFNFIADPSKTVDGFIAHEVQAVVPEAVTGQKDAVDADGKPVYQGIDQSKLVPLLTAALQEAIAKIETLEAKVAALESA